MKARKEVLLDFLHYIYTLDIDVGRVWPSFPPNSGGHHDAVKLLSHPDQEVYESMTQLHRASKLRLCWSCTTWAIGADRFCFMALWRPFCLS